MKKLLTVIALACAVSGVIATPASATIYRWVDAGGGLHFGDTLPDGVANVDTIVSETSGSTPTAPATVPVPEVQSTAPVPPSASSPGSVRKPPTVQPVAKQTTTPATGEQPSPPSDQPAARQ